MTIGNTRQVETNVLDGRADFGLVEGRTESDILRRSRDLDGAARAAEKVVALAPKDALAKIRLGETWRKR